MARLAPDSGSRMPAEWEPHEATWIAWPHERSDWPGKFAPIPWIYAEIVRHLAAHERVRILVESDSHREKARRTLIRAGAPLETVEFFKCPTNRSWVRDSGPIFVTSPDGRVSAIDWGFNGWAKYSNWQLDARVPGFIARRLGIPHTRPELVLEGGAVDVNGRGTLMTTEECLLGPVQSRNPEVPRDRIEAILGEHLGVRHFLWLGRGITGDDTHGHIDDIARFVGPSTVAAAAESGAGDPNYEPLRENLRRLRRLRDQDGNPLNIVKLPMPAPVYFAGQRLPASYANFYIANRIVLVPVFNDPNDRVALNTLARCFPDRTVVPIYCRDLVLGLGTLHCLTQQQPANRRSQESG